MENNNCDEANEIWKVIKGYEDYEISSLGRVRSIKYKNILSQNVGDKGYLTVTLQTKTFRKPVKVHKLMGLNFLENPNNLPNTC